MTARLTKACLLLLTGVAACHSAPPASEKEPPRAIAVDRIQTGAGVAEVTASGRLAPREEIAIAADLVGYRVASVLVDESDHVAAGQVLAQLDDSLIEPQIARAKAQLAEQEVASERARAEADRVQGLDGKGLLTDEAISERRLAVRSSAAQVAAARAQLDNLVRQREKLTIRAPQAGRILQRSIRAGDVTQSGVVLFTLARGNLIDLQAELPEASAARLQTGSPVVVETMDGLKLDGRVRLIGARVDPDTGAVITRVALPENGSLRAGGFAKATFTIIGRNALTAPVRAVRYAGKSAYVQVVDARNRIWKTPVTIGRRLGDRVEILTGPKAGTRVALSGGAFASDGDEITPSAELRP